MRKKTMAVLLAGAVAAAGIIGLTACKDGDDNGLAKGEQVSEEQWKAAITATAEAENYTASLYTENSSTASGKVGEETINLNYVETRTGTSYFDLANKKILSESTSTEKLTGGKLIDEEDGEETETYNNYFEADGLTLWAASYYDAETGWTTYSNTMPSEDYIKTYLSNYGIANILSRSEYSATQGGESKTISELYSAFNYDNGFYSATLYDDEGYDSKVTLSVKGGYVIGISVEGAYEYTEDEVPFHDAYKTVCTFSNFGSTTVTTPEGAAAAIAEAKTPSNN